MIARVSSIRFLQYILILASFILGSSLLNPTYAVERVDLSPVKKIRSDVEKTNVTPILTVTGQPSTDIVWESSYIPESNWYQLSADWPIVPGSEGYSLGLSKTEGADPGNSVTTTLSERHFKGVSPGVWYLNVKSLKDTRWSAVRSWEIKLEDTVFSVDLETTPATQEDILGISVEETPEILTEEDSKLLELRRKIEALMIKFRLKPAPLGDSDTIGLEEPAQRSSSFKPIQRSAVAGEAGSFTCDCSKKCKELSSCTEAYYQLFKCGCVNLDPNADSIPCGKFCGPARE